LKNNNTCACPHCANHIEFEEQSSGLEAQCPHCSGMLTLPAFTPETASAPVAPPLYNNISCQHFHLDIPFTRKEAGTEQPCLWCDEKLHYPEFNDDLLGVEEDRFLRIRGDQRSTIDSDAFSIEVTIWHVLTFLLLIPLLWLQFRSQDDIRSPIGMAVGSTFAIFMVYGVIHGVLINGIRKKARERRRGKIAALVELKPLSMGSTLEGHVHLELVEALSACSVGVSLELQAHKAQNALLSTEEGRTEVYELSCCRSSNIIASRCSINPGSVDLPFSIVAPTHQAHSYDEKFAIPPGLLEMRFRKKTAAMDAESLLKTTKLQWILHVDLLDADGVLLRSERVLKVNKSH
jgi:hypothetical protein